jgi:glycosyltransferase involved in cell wall biosynthesis
MSAVRSVLVLNDFCHAQGGASRVAIDEAVALRGSGVDVTFIGAVGPVDPELRAAGVETICLQQPQLLDASAGALATALWNRAAYRATRTRLKTLDPRHTIVHLHGYTKALTTTPVRAASRAGFTVVCTLHDFFAACPNGAFFDYRRQRPCTLRAMSVACVSHNCDKRHAAHKAYRVARGAVQRHILHFPHTVRDYITLSQQSAERLRPYLPNDARFHALANIIHVGRGAPVDAAANAHLVVVGRLDAEKGVMLAATAARNVGLPITFVGNGPLRAEVEATGARVTGWLAAGGVHRELVRARCLVFPSLWYETFGLTVDEAAAHGVPAIVSDVSAPAERVRHGETGWIYPSGDLARLESCLRLTRDDAVVRAAGALAHRHYWADPADPLRHVRQLTSIYERALLRNLSA